MTHITCRLTAKFRNATLIVRVTLGAVCFGLDPTVVTVRKCRLTYGLGVMTRFARGVHSEDKLVRRPDAAGARRLIDSVVLLLISAPF